MKEKKNYLIIITILILCVSFFDISSSYTNVIRFIVFSLFLWLAISYNKNLKNEESFVFSVLSLLYNPFYSVEIIKENIELIIKLTILFLLLFLIFKHKLFFYNLVKKYHKQILVIGISLMSFFVIKRIEQNRIEQNRIEQNRIEQKRIDSIQKQEAKIRAENNAIKSLIYCNEKTALENFKQHMEFYYPKWRMATKPKIRSDEDCKFKISLLVYETEYYFKQKESLVVEIDLNYDGNYEKYVVNFIQKPSLMR
jgi:hypothetical protein